MTHTLHVGARSRFVTVTAWTFIVLAALASVSALLQHASLASLPVPGADARLPLVTGWLLAYLPWVVAAALALSVATMGAAAGLLLRLDWARRVFIGLLALAVVVNVLGLWIQHEVVQSVVASTLERAPLPPQAAGVFDGFVTAARLLGGALTLGACALLVWVIQRLRSPAVRQEFA